MIGLHNLMGTWARKVQKYIAVSEYARDKYIAAGWLPEKIAVRPNFLHPAPAPGPGGGGYALYAGRLSPEKGIATMIEAWKSADKPLPLKIVGDGPLRELVMASCAGAAHIEYLGHMPLPDLLNIMGQAELLVFPSEGNETMGRTVMEAFAMGTPVLASALGPSLTMVVPGANGFHFAPGDVGSLRVLVEWCSRNLHEIRALRKGARASFDGRYTGPASLEMLLSIYRQARDAQS
jgi:glycosyltransferase involved in cell wall biosynthesis